MTNIVSKMKNIVCVMLQRLFLQNVFSIVCCEPCFSFITLPIAVFYVKMGGILFLSFLTN